MRDRPPRYLTVRSIVRERGIGERAIERGIRDRELACYRFDGWRRIREDDLEAWLARFRRPPGTPEGTR
jgi:excisionase family DNA binding protein